MIEICNVHRFLPYYICEDQLPPTIVHLRAESEVISQQAGVAAVVSRRRAACSDDMTNGGVIKPAIRGLACALASADVWMSVPCGRRY